MQAGREVKFQVWDRYAKQMWTWEDILIGETAGIISFIDMLQQDQFIKRQFTGLRDKNGKEIYEGDILEAPHDDGVFYLKVAYDEEFARYWFVDELDNGYCYAPDEFEVYEVKVVGNIYENPGLLQVG